MRVPSIFNRRGLPWAVSGNGYYGTTLKWAASPGGLIPNNFALTRAGTNASYVDSGGVRRTAAANAPRGTYRWNGSAFVFDGTLVEAATTNLNQNSRLASSASGYLNYTSEVFTNGFPSAWGDNAACKVVPSASLNFHATYGTGVVMAAGVNYAFSMDVCRDGSSLFGIQAGIYNGASKYVLMRINPVTGAITVYGGSGGGTLLNGSAHVDKLANGWYRIGLTGSVDVDSSMLPVFWVTDQYGGNYMTGDGVSGVLVDNIQLEISNGDTSPIITPIGSTAARSADSLTATTSDYLLNSQGVTAIKYRTIADAAGIGELFSTYAAGGIPLGYFSGSARLFDNVAGVWRQGPAFAPTVGGVQTVASTWGTGGCAIAANGAVTDGLAYSSLNLGSTLRIGDNVGAGGQAASMVLKEVHLGRAKLSPALLANAIR